MVPFATHRHQQGQHTHCERSTGPQKASCPESPSLRFHRNEMFAALAVSIYPDALA